MFMGVKSEEDNDFEKLVITALIRRILAGTKLSHPLTPHVC